MHFCILKPILACRQVVHNLQLTEEVVIKEHQKRDTTSKVLMLEIPHTMFIKNINEDKCIDCSNKYHLFEDFTTETFL